MREIFKTILEIAENNKISQPFAVGGIPRGLYLNNKKDLDSDIDITTNSSDITRLAVLVADHFQKFFKVFDDGHIALYLDDHIVDFSSNFISESAVDYIGNVDKDLKEVYSRDFTINTLHMNLETLEITDPIGSGKKDNDEKIIKTPVPPEISLTDDPNRLWRAINFSSRLGFDIDQEIIDFVVNNKKYFAEHPEIKPAYIENVIGETIKIDPERTLKNLITMEILDLVPLSGEFKKEIISRKMVKRYLDGL